MSSVRSSGRRAAAWLVVVSVCWCRWGSGDCGRLEDTGRFKVGAELGEERAGFSGRLKFTIFTSIDDPHWPAIEECLRDPTIATEMEHYVGVLVDETSDTATEANLRVQGFRGVGRSLSGQVIGILPAGFGCLDLLRVLQNGRVGRFNEKSPLYAVLVDSPDAIIDVARTSGCADAAKYANFIAEFEGEESEVAVSVRQWLARACFVFTRGDSNGDGDLDISDAVHMLSFLFLGETDLECEDMADSNDDGGVDIADVLYTLGHLFFACHSPPQEPFPEPATDPTPDSHACGEGSRP